MYYEVHPIIHLYLNLPPANFGYNYGIMMQQSTMYLDRQYSERYHRISHMDIAGHVLTNVFLLPKSIHDLH